MKLTIRAILFVLVAAYTLTSCLKGDPVTFPKENFTFMEFIYNPNGGSAVNAGLSGYGSAALTYPSSDDVDTATFVVAIEGTPSTVGRDVTVTLSVDNSALQDNFSNDSITYVAMPDSLYDFISTTATIPAGSSYATFQVKFYPSKIDITSNYMLPVTFANDANITIASNFSHLYFHAIGNPIAGAYTREWIRYNTATQTGSPAFDQEDDVTFLPVNPTTINVGSGTSPVVYALSFKESAGVFSNWKISLIPASVTAAGITISGGPTIITADPATGTYEFNFTYVNSAGSPRNITDKFTQ